MIQNKIDKQMKMKCKSNVNDPFIKRNKANNVM